MGHSRVEGAFTRFTPDPHRFIFAEFWLLLLTLAAVAATGYLTSGEYRTGVLAALIAGLLTIGFQAIYGRRKRRIVIGDDWIEGPARTGGERATIRFDLVDWESSGICRGQMRIRSAGSETVQVRTAWFSPEDLEELKRIIRDRSGGRQLESRPTWLTRLGGTGRGDRPGR